MQSEEALVQPIVVLVDSETTHSGLVEAAARASLKIYQETDPELWTGWLGVRFAKTVRRAKEKDFLKIQRWLDEEDFPYSVAEVGGSKALALPPTTYEAMPKLIRKCQVGGTDLPKDYTFTKSVEEWAPAVVMNASVAMSTGKCAAQAAHGLWMVHLRGDSADDASILYADAGEIMRVRPWAKNTVVDSGLTEFAAPTLTALVL